MATFISPWQGNPPHDCCAVGTVRLILSAGQTFDFSHGKPLNGRSQDSASRTSSNLKGCVINNRLLIVQWFTPIDGLPGDNQSMPS